MVYCAKRPRPHSIINITCYADRHIDRYATSSGAIFLNSSLTELISRQNSRCANGA
jgi:hypothetical protein